MVMLSFPAGFAALRNALESLYRAGEGDFTIACGDNEFKVHKLLLKAYSDVLYRMATSETFVVSGSSVLARWSTIPADTIAHIAPSDWLWSATLNYLKESRTGRAELKEVDSEHVKCMVQYFYRADYIISVAIGKEYNDLLGFHVNMAILAEMYNVAGLKPLAVENMRSQLPSRVNSREKLEVVLDMVYAEGVPEEAREALIEYVAKVSLTPIRSYRSAPNNLYKHTDKMHGVSGLRELLEQQPKFTSAVVAKTMELELERKLLAWGSDADEESVSGLSSISETTTDA